MPTEPVIVRPSRALPGARVELLSAGFPTPHDGPPRVSIGGADARVIAASSTRLVAIVPDVPGGRAAIHVADDAAPAGHVTVGRVVADDVHQVDSPLFDRLGRLYLTHSGTRETRAPVPLYRITTSGAREPLPVEIANPTSLALSPDGAVFVSSRFDGHVFKLTADDRAELYASELGVATGLAFDRDGSLFVGDRSGTILRITPERTVETYASLPASVAAFHLAMGPDDALYVAAPTLATHDPVYRISRERLVDPVCDGFGRPQGLAFDHHGRLFVVDALAGMAGLYRVDLRARTPTPELVLTAPSLVGVAFDADGGVALAANDRVWRFDSATFGEDE